MDGQDHRRAHREVHANNDEDIEIDDNMDTTMPSDDIRQYILDKMHIFGAYSGSEDAFELHLKEHGLLP